MRERELIPPKFLQGNILKQLIVNVSSLDLVYQVWETIRLLLCTVLFMEYFKIDENFDSAI